MIKKCMLCGKEFDAKPANRKLCYDDHYHPCPVCGKPVLSNNLQTQDSCCSKECADVYRARRIKESMVQKYGVDNPSHIPEARQKISKNPPPGSLTARASSVVNDLRLTHPTFRCVKSVERRRV